jgi:hypothetical protein
MTDGVVLDRDALASLAREAELLFVAAGLPLRPADHAELGEALEIWVLPPPGPAASWSLSAAKHNERLHHQVYRNGVPVAFVHSRLGPGGGTRFASAVFESSLARSLDQAIALADEAVPGPGDARLLHLPSENLRALWLITPLGEQLIPAVERNTHSTERLELKIYSPQEFFDALRGGP